jgi:WD40 repeat protein
LVFVGFTGDSKQVVTVCFNKLIEIWDAKTGKFIKRLDYKLKSNGVEAGAISPDGKTLLLAGQSLQMPLFDLETGEIWATFKSDGGPRTVAFSGDGSSVIVATQVGNAYLYEVPKKKVP